MKRDDADFELLQQPDDQHATIRFSGTLHGTEVIWQAQISTSQAAGEHGSVIEVGEIDANGSATLRVVLPLPRIDRAALMKTVLMIRQWKRLDHGRHRFGQPLP